MSQETNFHITCPSCDTVNLIPKNTFQASSVFGDTEPHPRVEKTDYKVKEPAGSLYYIGLLVFNCLLSGSMLVAGFQDVIPLIEVFMYAALVFIGIGLLTICLAKFPRRAVYQIECESCTSLIYVGYEPWTKDNPSRVGLLTVTSTQYDDI